MNKDVGYEKEQRLLIKDRLEDYLKQQELLTPERQHAINQARFECARMIWLSDRNWALNLIQKINLSQPKFIPTGQAAPSSYRAVYRLLGFSIAEQLAEAQRKLKGRLFPI